MARTPNNHHVLPLFCDDLIASCVDMTPARFGAYMRLLCYAWTRGGLPNDEAACGRIAGGMDCHDWQAIRARLVLLDAGMPTERLSHQRLELEREAVAILKAKKSEAGKKGGRPKANGKQNESNGKANGKQTESKTKAPTPTPSPSSLREEVIHTHAASREPWAENALDRWTTFREEWNQTPGAEPWKPLTPPSGSLWIDRIGESAWLEQYPIALGKLAGLKRFKNAVTLTQFLADGWVGRIVAGDFDKPQEARGYGAPAQPPPQDASKRRFYKADAGRSMTEAEYAIWKRDQRTGGVTTALANGVTLKEEAI